MLRSTFLQCVWSLVFISQCHAGAAALTEVTYSGALTEAGSDGDILLRPFEVVVLRSPNSRFFSVLDDPRDGCPWPESFGQVNAPNAVSPHLRYNYDRSPYNIPLPSLWLAIPDAANGATWEEGPWNFEITGAETVDGVPAWKIEAREGRGRRQSLIVSQQSGELLQSSQDVFMGQGEQFKLVMTRTATKPLPEDQVENVVQLQSQLLALQAGLKRRPDSQLTELSARQVEDTQAQIDGLSQLAKDTPLQETVLRIRRDVDRQQKRVAQAMDRREQLIAKEAPKFSLNALTGEPIESAKLAGKILVIHFWNYADKPLSEPYGQVGYLEFLYNKRKVNSVEVIGVAMNPSLQQAESNRAGKRAARKLMEFMNLSYPIGYDNGSLLQAFGDPRDADGELPLWVVVSPAGQIVHYHAGFYEIDQRQGLKELDDVLIEQIRAVEK